MFLDFLFGPPNPRTISKADFRDQDQNPIVDTSDWIHFNPNDHLFFISSSHLYQTHQMKPPSFQRMAGGLRWVFMTESVQMFWPLFWRFVCIFMPNPIFTQVFLAMQEYNCFVSLGLPFSLCLVALFWAVDMRTSFSSFLFSCPSSHFGSGTSTLITLRFNLSPKNSLPKLNKIFPSPPLLPRQKPTNSSMMKVLKKINQQLLMLLCLLNEMNWKL